MKIIIEGDAKEIAALVVAIQEQQEVDAKRQTKGTTWGDLDT